MRASGAVAYALAIVACTTTPARAQAPDVRGYYLHAGLAVNGTPLTDGGLFDVQRLRLMTAPRVGPWAFDVAYEHAIDLRTAPLAIGRGFEGAEAADPWLALQGTLVERRHVHWRHGFDRLSVSGSLGEGRRLIVGRQAVSWATTLFFTPADPFAPFDPADPFREFRAGIDAARVQIALGPLSQFEAVVRPSSTPVGTTLTALARASGVAGGWEVSGWGGALHDEAAGAMGVTGAIGAFAVRGEVTVRREAGSTVLRAAAGVDRRLLAFARDLHVVVEYQHDGFGARTADDLIEVAAAAPFQRGEQQVLGRDALVVSATFQAHPLLSVSGLALANVRDGSVLFAPGVAWSAADEVSVRAGLFAGLGRGATAPPPRLGSEHGGTPLVGYVAVSVFF
jgi:hypothetical protein